MSHQLKTIPALDTTPTGRLPHAVAKAPVTVDAAVAQFEALREGADENMNHFIDGFTALLKQVGDPAEVADLFLSEATADRTKPADVCPAYRDCTVTEPGHTDHFSQAEVLDDADGSTILDAGLTALSGTDRHAIVYLRNAEFTDAASLHAKTAELRRFLDQVDALADRVFTDHEAQA